MRKIFLSTAGRKTRLQVVLILMALLVFSACEVETTLKVSGGNPPTFDPHGSGDLGFFWVREASWDELKSSERGLKRDKLIVWEIWPQDADAKMSNLPDITYGQLPQGFRQTIPDYGSAPPLVEGKLYLAGGLAANAKGGSIYFTINKGVVSEVSQTP